MNGTETGNSRVSNGEGPLWQRVQDDIRERIRNGEFASGVPGELALSEEYEVSRSTIRAALLPLRQQGVISSSRGKVSEVNSLAGRNVYGPVYSLFAAVENSGMAQRNRVECAEKSKSACVAKHLQLAADTDLIHIARTRMADGEVIAYDEAWFPPEAASLLTADLEAAALYDVLSNICGIQITRGHEKMRAIVLDADQAALLEAEVGEPALVIERMAYDGDRPVEWRTTIARGEKFTVTTTYP